MLTRYRRTLAAALAVTGLGLIPACATGLDPIEPTTGLNSVNVIDDGLRVRTFGLPPSLESVVALDAVDARRTAAGTLGFVAAIRNRTGEPLAIEVRALFFDERSVPVENPSAWTRVFLAPHATETYRQSSSRTFADRYTIEIRKAL
jgi:hypothetical protein